MVHIRLFVRQNLILEMAKVFLNFKYQIYQINVNIYDICIEMNENIFQTKKQFISSILLSKNKHRLIF